MYFPKPRSFCYITSTQLSKSRNQLWCQYHLPVHRPHSSQLSQPCAFPLLVQDLLNLFNEYVSHLVLTGLQFPPIWNSSSISPCVLRPPWFQRVWALYSVGWPSTRIHLMCSQLHSGQASWEERPQKWCCAVLVQCVCVERGGTWQWLIPPQRC